MEHKYIISDPQLIKEWDFQKNDITPDKVTLFSSKKRWWICENGYKDHSYEAVVADKYRDKTRCPYCSNRKVLKGFNDLATKRPDLLIDWDYKNNSKTPFEITAGSNYLANWKCHTCGYKWKASVSSRAGGSGCKECAKVKRVETANKLRISKRGSFADKYPDLLLDYDYSNNPSPNTLSFGSKTKVRWICHICGTKWEAPIYSRGSGHQGCPRCAKAQMKANINKTNVKKIGSLASKYPELLKEWDYQRNDCNPDEIPCTSHKSVWWKCPKCGRKWKNSVRNRTIHKQGCSCEVSNLISVNVKKTYLDKNGSLKDKYPVVLNEWDYGKNNAIGLTPENVSPFSQQEAFWHCPKCGFEWKQIIAQKTFKLALCPKCSRESKTSFPEQAIFYYLNKCTYALNREKVFGYEIDIFLPKVNVGIEYDGMRFHKDKKLNYDKKKDKDLSRKGIKIFRIKESKDNESKEKYNVNVNQYIKSLNNVISKLARDLGFNVDVNIKRDEQKIYSQYVSLLKPNNLVVKCPDIAKEWNYERNGNIKPEMVSFGTNKVFWWKCSKCGFEYKSSVQIKTSGKGGHCPNCWPKKKVGRPKKK